MVLTSPLLELIFGTDFFLRIGMLENLLLQRFAILSGKRARLGSKSEPLAVVLALVLGKECSLLNTDSGPSGF